VQRSRTIVVQCVHVRTFLPRKQTSPQSAPVPNQPRHLQSSSEESSPSRSSNHHNQRVCCDHQFTDRCSVRESPTRPRSSPLRLDPQASPDGASRLPLHLAHTTFTAHSHVRSSTRITLTLPHAHYSPLIRSAPRRQDMAIRQSTPVTVLLVPIKALRPLARHNPQPCYRMINVFAAISTSNNTSKTR
jgi:hypothetical protein